MEISTPCRIATPQNFILKFGARDNVLELTPHANFGGRSVRGGFSQNT